MGPVGAAVDITSDDKEISLAINPSGDALDRTSNLLFEDFKRFDDSFDDSVAVQQSLASLDDEKKSLCNGSGGGDDDDDDCVMLDGDPDKALVVAMEKKLEADDSEEELQITVEKGEVVCRDFPHPRHLCARLPFGAGSPANHCTMCHCYVCESRAPCPYWGNGILRTDHCRGTDKDEKWRKLRESFKRRGLPASSSQVMQVNQPSVPRVSAASSASQNQLRYPSIRAARNTGKDKVAYPPRPSAAHWPTITGERFKRSGASPTAYTSPVLYDLHRSVVNGAVLPPAYLRLLQAAQVTPAGNNIAAGSVQAHSHQRAVNSPALLRAIQVQPAASRFQVTPNRAAAASRLQVTPNRAAAAGTSTAHQSSSSSAVNILRKSWQDVFAGMEPHIGVHYQDAGTSSHGQQSASTDQSLHPSQFSAQVRASQGSSDSNNVPAIAPMRLLSNDALMQILKAEGNVDRHAKKHKRHTY